MRNKGFGRARPLGIAVGAAVVALGLAASPAGASSSRSASVNNDTLTVTGGSSGDRLALRLAAGSTGTLEVDFDDNGSADFSFDRSTFSKIAVNTRSGNDQFRIDQVNGAFADEAITVDGGAGRDVLNGGDGTEEFIGGSGNDAVDGNKGNDTANLGSGNDTFTWDPGDGSDLIDGQTGRDTLDFNGAGAAEVMSLSANGQRSLFLRDLGNIRMDMDNVENLDLTALGGADLVTVNDMSGTDFRRADVDLGGGDAAVDTLTLNGTANADRIEVDVRGGTEVEANGLQTSLQITGSEPTDLLQINTLDGNDTVDVDNNVDNVIGVSVDLGSGQPAPR